MLATLLKLAFEGVFGWLLLLDAVREGRLQAAPFIGYPGARAAGIKAADALRDWRLHVKAARASVERFGVDLLLPLLDLTAEAEALGADVSFRELEPPHVSRHISLSELASTEPNLGGRLWDMLKVARELGSLGLSGFYASGPLTIAAQAAGLGKLFSAVLKGEADRAIEVCGELFLEYAGALSELVDIVVVAEPVASLVPPDVFERLSLPYLRRLKECVIHVCGDAWHVLPYLAEFAAGVSVDSKVDLREACRRWRNVVWIGNYPPASLVVKSPSEVYEEVFSLYSGLRGLGDIVACTGCDVPARASFSCIESFMEAARRAFSSPVA